MTITRTLITSTDRQPVLPQFFGNHHLRFEQTVYALCDQYCQEYTGGFWQFYRLSNDGFYMSLDSEKSFTFDNPNNYFCDTVDADTLSIIVNLYALNHLSFDFPHACFSPLYHKLLDYAVDHPHAANIYRAID